MASMINSTEPIVSVGIIASKEISFRLEGDFGTGYAEQNTFKGKYKARLQDDVIYLVNDEGIVASAPSFMLEPFKADEALICLENVTIGINFHWERREEQCFKGALKLIIVDRKIQVINVVKLETYLESVISSEMRPTASLPFLKAHAVISRGWLMAQINRKSLDEDQTSTPDCKEGEWIKWYDKEDHVHFDVCADDHCQRYQGVPRMPFERAKEAVALTRGEVLMSGDDVCEARFSKCCGGVTERFSSCWSDNDFPYLVPVQDNQEQQNPKNYDLRQDEDAERWIYDDPEAFCNTSDPRILIQVLNEYDQETRDFFRWRRDVRQDFIQQKVEQMFHCDLGEILDLVPLKRGESGRIIKLKVVGRKTELVVGKELEIRKLLSDSHLYSSAFIVEKVNIIEGVPQGFILKGAGWGHGVGLCQIGAAVMGVRGYDYGEILAHYFKGTRIEKCYE